MGIDPMGDCRELGYEFKERRLVKVGSDEAFEFQGQDHYDRLAGAVVEYVALLLEDEARLEPLWLPLGIGPGDGCPIFVSPGFDKARQLLLIINGSGRVRAGVWSCALCINKGLEWGTALPYIHAATESGYAVVVLNPNHNKDSEGEPIRGSETPEKHVAYVWDKVLTARCMGCRVDVLAHSAAGRGVLSLLRFAPLASHGQPPGAPAIHRIVFTDSYHVSQQVALLPRDARELLRDEGRVINYVPHDAPMGTRVDKYESQEYSMTSAEKGCSCISAGVHDHASTNYAVLDHAMQFLLHMEIGDSRGVTQGLSPPCETQLQETLTDDSGPLLMQNSEAIFESTPSRRNPRHSRTAMVIDPEVAAAAIQRAEAEAVMSAGTSRSSRRHRTAMLPRDVADLELERVDSDESLRGKCSCIGNSSGSAAGEGSPVRAIARRLSDGMGHRSL